MQIERIGSAGDGMSLADDGPALHVARTLPGERAQVQPMAGTTRADLLAINAASPDRVAPPCPHFAENCGGCALQHWADAPYATWKHGLVAEALRRAGFAAPRVLPLIRTAPGARRRMDFAVQRRQGGVQFGLHRAHTTEIVDLLACTVLHPALLALRAPLRALLSSLGALRLNGSVLANLLEGGADLLIRTDGPLAATDRAKLADFARACGIQRISWAGEQGPIETASLLSMPAAHFAGHRVDLPPGAFLQASSAGEAAIVAAVLAGLPARITGKSRAIELFAGCGTLSFPLARHLRVQAYEGDALAAAAVRRAQAGSRVEMTQRDLARQPLSAKELSGAAMVLLDPPYAGAAPQMAAIAQAGVPVVAYVSCNPMALTRDVTVLAQAGYSLVEATPIDQFLWSPQVESVAIFMRATRKAG